MQIYIDINYSRMDVPTMYFYHYSDLDTPIHIEAINSSNCIYEHDIRFEINQLIVEQTIPLSTSYTTLGYDLNGDVFDGTVNIYVMDTIVINAGVLNEDVKDVSNNDNDLVSLDLFNTNVIGNLSSRNELSNLSHAYVEGTNITGTLILPDGTVITGN